MSRNLIANCSRRGIISTGSHHTDQLKSTQTSSEDNCENLESFVSFSTEDAYCKSISNCENKALKANADGFPEGSKEAKRTRSAKPGKIFFVKVWKENAVDETDKKEDEDSNASVTNGGSGKTVF